MTSSGGSSPKTVLVVDDSVVMRRILSEIVSADPDFRVVDVAENGRVALRKVREHKPDCVLLDIEMPELSGLDTLRRLGLRSRSKVVIVSYLGYEGSAERAEAFRLGAADVIEKPSGSVSMDLASARGTLINQTLRRVLGLPAMTYTPPLPTPAPLVVPTPVNVQPVRLPSELAAVPSFDPATLVHVMDAIDTGVLIFDREARLTYANTAADRVLARSRRERTFRSVDDVFDDVHRSLAVDVRAVIATGQARHPILAALPDAPSAAQPLCAVLPLPAVDGGVTGAFMLLTPAERGGTKVEP